MSTQKFSVSFEASLAAAVRKATAADGVTLSSWLAAAAAEKSRQRHLREALDAFAAERGGLDDAEVEALVRKARRGA
jgi:triphosphoribosyl-dephospho-CoA synthetase